MCDVKTADTAVCDVKKRLTKEMVESARVPQMAPSVPVAVNVDDDKTAYMRQPPPVRRLLGDERAGADGYA